MPADRSRRAIERDATLTFPVDYDPVLNLRETEEAIKFIKDLFEDKLASALNLIRVTAPILVTSGTGINDHLSGVEAPVTFTIKSLNAQAEIVQSLAKWKRLALANYGFGLGEGLYTDMNALRPDEVLDNLHSVYVDQWDWERVIGPEDRNVAFLQTIVGAIHNAIVETERAVCQQYPGLEAPWLPEEITFVHSEDLEARYPELTPKEREDTICREHGAVFVIGIGAPLASGSPHDNRAADYDDWSTPTGGGRHGLNGDILVWYPPLDCALELSSMGVRVDGLSLERQLDLKDENNKRGLYFHSRLIEGSLPLCVGGGLGQSRLCMLFLRRAHVGEVQAGVWPQAMVDSCAAHSITLL